MNNFFINQWNNHGYDVVKMMGGKFTHISPVWLQLRNENGNIFITGMHDIDRGWIQEVRKASGNLNAKSKYIFIFF